MGGSFHGGIYHEGREFPALLKKEKINQTNFSWKSGSALKPNKNRDYYVYKGFRFPHNTLLFKLIFLIVLKSRNAKKSQMLA